MTPRQPFSLTSWASIHRRIAESRCAGASAESAASPTSALAAAPTELCRDRTPSCGGHLDGVMHSSLSYHTPIETEINSYRR